MEPNYPPTQEPPHETRPKPRPIAITVIKDPRTGQLRLNLEPPTLDLAVNEQVAWRTRDGRLEIRFAPGSTPFAGATYKTARGGTIFSGAPGARKVTRTPYLYTLLVTTPEGFFIKQDADLRVVDQTTPPRPTTENPPTEHKGGLLCRIIRWLESICCRD